MGLLPSRALLRWPDFGRKRFIADEFAALVRYLREAGCSFHSCSALGTHPVPRGISFRYDVHVRDLPGAFIFADLHLQHGIPATFFVFWDYSPHERDYLKTFLKLRDRATPPLEIGLHDSPVDAHLIQHKFGNDRKSYAAWLDGSDAPAWLSRLSEAPDELEALNSAAQEDFEVRVEKTRELFGPVRTVAGHGGEIGQKLRGRFPELGPAATAIALGFFSRNWLTAERVRAASLDAAVDCYGNFVEGWKEFGCRGGAITSLSEKIRRYLSVRNSAIQLLLHPYTWTGAERDAEFSQALFVHGPPKAMDDDVSLGHAPDRVSSPHWRDLQDRWPQPPSLAQPVSQLCTISQFREPEYARLCGILGETPRPHRKQWEFAYILRCLEKAGAMGEGRRGLGFLREPECLPAAFASQDCTIVATPPSAADEAAYRDRLFVPLLDRSSFDRRVTVLRLGSNTVLSESDFDFCWSSAAGSHAGSLESGLQFLERSLQYLKPGGVAVHIVEFNLESPIETVAKGPVVLYREADLQQFAARMQAQGHQVTLNLHPGAEVDDLRVEPGNPDFHLKVLIQDVLSTSAGICIRKAP